MEKLEHIFIVGRGQRKAVYNVTEQGSLSIKLNRADLPNWDLIEIIVPFGMRNWPMSEAVRDSIREFHDSGNDASRLARPLHQPVDGPTGNDLLEDGDPYRTAHMPPLPALVTRPLPANYWQHYRVLQGDKGRVALPLVHEASFGEGNTVQAAYDDSVRKIRQFALDSLTALNNALSAMRQWRRDVGMIPPNWAPDLLAVLDECPERNPSDIELSANVLSTSWKGNINAGGGVNETVFRVNTSASAVAVV